MRWLLLLLVWSLTAPAFAGTKSKKKRVTAASRQENLRMWDGTEADVAWVNENTLPTLPRRPVTKTFRPWFSLTASGGHRLFRQDAPMVLQDDNQQILSEGRFVDLIENVNAFEARMLLHPFSFLSIGASYHVDETKLKVNNQPVSLAPQELSGTLQIGPRLGFVRIYGFYTQIVASRSTASINAPTVVNDPSTMQTFEVEVKQSGHDAGAGMQLNWGHLGFFAEAVRSLERSYELNISLPDSESPFHTKSQPSFKAWQFGLSLDF